MPKKDWLRQTAERQARAASGTRDQRTLREAALLGGGMGDDAACAHVNLKYYWPDHQCFSDWQPDELKGFSRFCRTMAQMRWQDIYRSGGGSGHKSGLGYTPHKNPSVLPEHPDLSQFSPDLTWFELRVSGKARVHGFRVREAFFLVFLDRSHAVYR